MTQQGNAGGLNIDDMAEVVRAMPAYQDRLGEYNIHIDLLTQIKKFWTDRNQPRVVEEEQSIATGKDMYGKSYRFKDFASIKESPTDSDRIRKILLLWLCTDLEDREVSTLKSGVVGAKPGEEKYMEALSMLGLTMGGHKLPIQKTDGGHEASAYDKQDRSNP
jgi:hypothetical protein